MKRIRHFWVVLKKAVVHFIEDEAFRLSAALSYYTVFALGPLLLIVISMAGIFWGPEAVKGRIYGQINGLVGHDAALQVQSIISNIQQTHHSVIGAVIGFVVLFIAATGVFTEIQASINYIWSVKAKPQKGWLRFLQNRVLSFSLIIGMGFLLLVSLIVNAVVDLLSERLQHYFPDDAIHVFYFLNTLLMLLIIGCLFAVIFRVLPDATIKWKDAFAGAVFTTLLFLGGKFLIGFYLGNSGVGATYGAAASIVVILLWVYYSSIILYLGAEFTKVYAIEAGSGIRPNSTAVFVLKHETREIPESYRDT